MTIYSSRRLAILVIFIPLALILFFIGLGTKETIPYGISCLFLIISFVAYLLSRRTEIRLETDQLTISVLDFKNQVVEQESILINDIQYAAFDDEEKINTDQLYRNFLWELMFPSGNCYFIVQTSDKRFRFIFNGNDTAVKELIEKLPNKIPFANQ
jgi:hypothetical protein